MYKLKVRYDDRDTFALMRLPDIRSLRRAITILLESKPDGARVREPMAAELEIMVHVKGIENA